eukprot:scaffold7207_cov520-Prasinococcus_capsulatus_cf.AAC.5
MELILAAAELARLTLSGKPASCPRTARPRGAERASLHFAALRCKAPPASSGGEAPAAAGSRPQAGGGRALRAALTNHFRHRPAGRRFERARAAGSRVRRRGVIFLSLFAAGVGPGYVRAHKEALQQAEALAAGVGLPPPPAEPGSAARAPTRHEGPPPCSHPKA